MNDYLLRIGLDGAAMVTGFAMIWLVQSSLLLGGGLIIGWLLRQRGPAAQSLIYRATLVAIVACPIAAWAARQLGVPRLPVNLPAPWTLRESALAATPDILPSRTVAAENAANVPPVEHFDQPSHLGSHNASLSNDSLPTANAASLRESNELILDSNPHSQHEPTRDTAPPGRPQHTASVIIQPFGMIAFLLCLIWFAGTATLLARIAWAWRHLKRLRQSAVHAAPVTSEICRKVASLMGINKPEVKHTPFLPCPCLAGIRRPVVLLPDVHMSMHLRDVLVHELAHLKRRDCQWTLLRQLVTALFFFQPLLWKLARCMDATSEEVCDDYVVRLGGDRKEYAHRLVDMAQSSSNTIALAGVGMVMIRSLLGKRVLRILDTSRPLSTHVGAKLLILATFGAIGALTTVGMIGIQPEPVAADPLTVAAEDASTELSSPQRPANDKSDTTNNDCVTVRGRVVDPDGRAVENADVYAVRWYWDWGDKKPLAQAKTDGNGQFEITYSKSDFFHAGRVQQWREAVIAAFAQGYGPDWVSYDDIPSGTEPTLRLVADDVPIEGRIVDKEGKPVKDAKIDVLTIAASADADLSDWIRAVKAGQSPASAHKYLDKGTLPEFVPSMWDSAHTDADGRFRISGIGAQRLVHLRVSGSKIVTKTLDVVTRLMEPIKQPAYDYPDAFFQTNYGARFEYVAAESAPIEGIVRDRATGKPLAGVQIWSDKFAGENIHGIHTIKTRTDQSGRYRLEGMPRDKGNEIVVVPLDLPYFTREVDVPDPPGTAPVELNIDLSRGVWVKGKVTDGATHQPVPARMHYVPFPDNPHAPETPAFVDRSYDSIQDQYHTEVDGSYRIVALPGRGIIGVDCISQVYPGGQGYNAIKGIEDRDAFQKYGGVFAPSPKFPTAVKEVNPKDGQLEVRCDFRLDRGRSISIQAVDPEGTPLAGVEVAGIHEVHGSWFRPVETNPFELLAFRDNEVRTVLIRQQERNLGRGLHVKASDSEHQPVVVKLEPCATVQGRLVDGSGAPVRGVALRFDIAHDRDYGRSLARIATDADGRFTRHDVPTGLPYSIFAEGAGIKFTVIIKELDAEPGETIDLGTIDITTDKRPKPKRTESSGSHD